MANYVITSANSVSIGTAGTSALTLNAGDNVFVTQTGHLTAWGTGASYGIAINGDADNGTVIVEGAVFGTNNGIYNLADSMHIDIGGSVTSKGAGINILGNSNALTIGAGGSVSGFYGVSLGGQFNTLVNHGTISGADAGTILIGGVFQRVVNTGTISSVDNAFTVSGDSAVISNAGTIVGDLQTHFLEDAAELLVRNSGLWEGQLELTVHSDQLINSGMIAGAVEMKAGSDVVRNAGSIGGNVSLGEGHDMLDTRLGEVGGDITGGDGMDGIYGSSFDDVVSGDADADTLRGYAGSDDLHGGSGNDSIDGGVGDDTITGSTGAEGLRGRAGADAFVYVDVTDSTVSGGGRDTILDFRHVHGDVIDLSEIDAKTTASGNQAFSFIETAEFSGVAGQLRYKVSGDRSVVYGDINGDGTADFSILVENVTTLAAADFVL